MPTSSSISRVRVLTFSSDISGLWSLMTSSTWSPMRNTGFREVMGSWKIMEMRLPRISCILAVGVLTMLSALPAPSRFRRISPPTTWPVGRCRSCIRLREVTDLPQPDSPTTPTVEHLGISKEMPSTALTTPMSVKK